MLRRLRRRLYMLWVAFEVARARRALWRRIQDDAADAQRERNVQ